MFKQKISPCLWFDHQAEEAANFYVAIFKNSKILHIARYGQAGSEVSGRPKGSVMTVTFQLDGAEFMALNGGPLFTFSPAISLMAYCQTQEEIDHLWAKLSADKTAEQCGWLKDKYGVSWQIVPQALDEMMRDSDAKKTERVMQALLSMKKLDLEALRQAYQQ